MNLALEINRLAACAALVLMAAIVLGLF